VRAFATNSGRKTDDTDAYSIALVGLHTPDLPVVTRDEQTEMLRILSGRRRELVALRTQAVCRLHRELVILIPGGASRRLTAKQANVLLGKVRPADEVDRLRKSLARDQLADLVAIDKRLAAINTEIRTAVRASGSRLTRIVGIGPVNAAMVIGGVGDVARFATRAHFAAYNGTAPAQWGSGGTSTTGSTSAGTASSTTPCTSPRSPRPATPGPAGTTTNASSPPARPRRKHCAHSSDGSATRSTDNLSPTPEL